MSLAVLEQIAPSPNCSVGQLAFSTTLYRNMEPQPSPEVACLQKILTEKACGQLGVDGYFGPDTDAGVRLFQGAAQVDVDGYVGPDTVTALNNIQITCSASGTLPTTTVVINANTTVASVAESTTTTVALGENTEIPVKPDIKDEFINDSIPLLPFICIAFALGGIWVVYRMRRNRPPRYRDF